MRKVEMTINFPKYGGYDVHGYLFEPEDGKVKSVLYVMHGLTEHMGRYEELAKVLTHCGIAVAGIDLRGHGKSEEYFSTAAFGKNGWENVLYDLHSFYDFLYVKYANPQIYMLGFSLGSFLLREYINKYNKDKIAGAIIMGTGTQPSFVLSMVMAVVKGEINKVGINETSKTIKKLSFGEYNKKFKPNKTDFDWLCSDENSLQDYIDDSLCKKDISAGLFYDLLASMKKTSMPDAYEHVNKELPILLLSGTHDPVGNMSKGVKQVYNDMLKAGFKNVKLELFDNARHDILHESSVSSKVVDCIMEFINE